MRNIVSLLAALCICSLSFAQNTLPEFGKIDMADMQMKECSFDKGADAMNLFKQSFISITPEGKGTYQVVTEVRVRAKIFNSNGFPVANITIPFYSYNGSAKIADIEAAIYNTGSNNTVEKVLVDKKQIFKDIGNSRQSVNSIHFTFPGLKPGCIIEYHYTKKDKNVYNISPCLMQDEIPTLTSICSFKAPQQIETNTRITGILPVQADTSFLVENDIPEHLYSFTLQKVPAIKYEPFMPSDKDAAQRIEFSITPPNSLLTFLAGQNDMKWAIYNSYLLSFPFFGGQFGAGVNGIDGLLDSIKKFSATKKIQAVYQFVVNNVAWDKEQTFLALNVNDAVKNKTGNSAQLNLLLLNILRKTGVSAYPLLISTRTHGITDPGFPSLGQFDGVDILAFDEQSLYILDGTQKNQSFKLPPANVLNRDGFIVNSSDSKWVSLTDGRVLANDSIYVAGQIDSTAQVSGNASTFYIGYSKAKNIQLATGNKSLSIETTGNSLFNDIWGNIKIDSTVTLHNDDDNDTLTRFMQFHYPLANSGNLYFVKPLASSLLSKKVFTGSSRLFNIDFGYKQRYSEKYTLQVAPCFTIEELPANKELITKDSSLAFSQRYTKTGDSITVSISININRPVFLSTEYNQVKDFFDKVQVYLAEEILLKRKD